TANQTSSPTTSGKGRTSSRRSWTADMWNWVRSGWNSRARDHRHDGQRLYAPHRVASRANVAPQPGTAKGRLAEEPQDLRLSGCGIARDCGGALQFVWQEDAWTKGQRERGTPATDLAGQHRQQRAGVEEPASVRTSERAAGNNGRRCIGRSCSCARDAPAAGCSRGLWADRRCCALYSGPTLPTSAAGQHAATTHAGATAGTANRSKRTRTC